ncbi:MAG: cytochrome c biogenesis CcdA family protein [Candidatus Limnocylindria bacterium]
MGELLGAVVLGIGATITPCILPLYPAFLAFLTGSDGRRSVPPVFAAALVWAGVVIGMVLIGLVFALLSFSLSRFIGVILPIADALLIILGLLLLLGRNPFARLPQLAPAAFGRGGPAFGAFAYGLLFAPIALPCSGPFLVGIFAFSLTIVDVVDQLAFFFAFGVGFGLPLFLLGLIGQARGRDLARALVRWERGLQIVIGVALIVIGIWDLLQNLPSLLE